VNFVGTYIGKKVKNAQKCNKKHDEANRKTTRAFPSYIRKYTHDFRMYDRKARSRVVFQLARGLIFYIFQKLF